MAQFIITVSADMLPDVEGEQLRATITNITQGRTETFTGPADVGSFNIDYTGNYGDQLSIVRDFVLGTQDGPDTEATLVSLPFPALPVPTGGAVSVRLA